MKEYKEYGVYVENERYYSVKGKEIKNIKAYYQACRTIDLEYMLKMVLHTIN